MSATRVVAPLAMLVRLRPFSSSTVAERSTERYRRAGLTMLASFAAQGTTTLTTLVSVPLALGYLGTERYGLWMSAVSLVAIVAAADLGIGNGLLNAIAEAHGKEDRRLAGQYASSAFFLLSAVAVALGATVALLRPFVPWAQVLNATSSSVSSDTEPVVLILLGCSFLTLPFGVAARIHMGYQEGFVNGFWQALGSIVGLLGLLTALLFRMSMAWLVLGLAVGPLLGAMSNLAGLAVGRNWLMPRWSAVRRRAVLRLLQTGLMFAFLQAVVAVAYLSDNLVVARLFGPDAAAMYAVHATLLGLVPLVAMVALSPMWPAYGEALARGDTGWLRHALVRSVVLTFLFVSIGSGLLLLMGQPLMRIWVGTRITPSISLMVALAVWGVLSSVGSALSMFLNGVGVLRMQVTIACVMGAVAVVAKVLFGIAFGLAGVAWGTSVAYGLFGLVPLMVVVPKVVARLGKPAHT
jgi:O-antigen/teichoic acid export membrane protein